MKYKYCDASKQVVFDGEFWSGLVTSPEVQTWLADGNEPEPHVEPPQPVPSVLTMRQARLALLQAGKLQAVADAINSLESPQKEAAQIEWEYSQEVQRANGFVSLLAPALGMDDAALDELFVLGASL